MQLHRHLDHGSLDPREASLVVQMGKNPTAVRETWVQSLGWADPLEEGKAPHSRVLAWRIPWTEEPGGIQSMRSDTTEVTEHRRPTLAF